MLRYVTLQKYFSHPSFSYLLFFPTPPIKRKPGLQIDERLLIATHLDQSANKKQEAVNNYDLTLFIRLFQGSSRALKSIHFSRVTAFFHGFTGQDCCASSQISRPHTEHCWRCSKKVLHYNMRHQSCSFLAKRLKLIIVEDCQRTINWGPSFFLLLFPCGVFFLSFFLYLFI